MPSVFSGTTSVASVNSVNHALLPAVGVVGEVAQFANNHALVPLGQRDRHAMRVKCAVKYCFWLNIAPLLRFALGIETPIRGVPRPPRLGPGPLVRLRQIRGDFWREGVGVEGVGIGQELSSSPNVIMELERHCNYIMTGAITVLLPVGVIKDNNNNNISRTTIRHR